jgi:multicomponent Na+:H+ antiporter subunit D
VVTFAALAKAAWMMFLRRRTEPYEDEQPLAAGMAFALIALGVICVGFGLLPGRLAGDVTAPAASALLHPDVYAAGVLRAMAVRLPVVHVHSSFVSLEGLLSTSITLVLGGVLAARVIRRGSLRVVDALRSLHTGSVNDYATYAAVGMVVAVAVLRFGWTG